MMQRGRNAAVHRQGGTGGRSPLAGRAEEPDWTLLFLFFLQSCKKKAWPHAQDPPQKASRMCTSSWDALGRATLSPHCPLPKA